MNEWAMNHEWDEQRTAHDAYVRAGAVRAENTLSIDSEYSAMF